jgi:hypothetical protein
MKQTLKIVIYSIAAWLLSRCCRRPEIRESRLLGVSPEMFARSQSSLVINKERVGMGPTIPTPHTATSSTRLQGFGRSDLEVGTGMAGIEMHGSSTKPHVASSGNAGQHSSVVPSTRLDNAHESSGSRLGPNANRSEPWAPHGSYLLLFFKIFVTILTFRCCFVQGAPYIFLATAWRKQGHQRCPPEAHLLPPQLREINVQTP